MAIYDRWWRTERKPDGTQKRVHSADYGCEARWQVRWRDEHGKQRTQAFAKKAEAERTDAKIRSQLAEGTYVDPAAAWSPSVSMPKNGVKPRSRSRHRYPDRGSIPQSCLLGRGNAGQDP